MSEPRPGDRIGSHYRLIEKVGEGGMGRVFRSEDLRNPGHPIVLKLLSRLNVTDLNHFREEFSILTSSRHPNILRVFDFGIDEKTVQPYYTAEWVNASPIHGSGRTWNEEKLIDLSAQILRALKFLHSRGVVHGDIKPSNILDRSGTYLLIDFGIATASPEKRDGSVLAGTTGFMAPEILEGTAPDSRADLYSLGATLTYLGSRTSTGKQGSPFYREFLQRLMNANRDGRFSSAGQALLSLRRNSSLTIDLETPETAQAYVVSPLLVGRDSEMSRISQELNTHGFAFITGPRGIGKTRMLRELKRREQLTSGTVQWLTCHPTTHLESLYALIGDNVMGNWIGKPPKSLILIDDFEQLPEDERQIWNHSIRRLTATPGRPIRICVASEWIGDVGRSIGLNALSSESVVEYLKGFQFDAHPQVTRAFFTKTKGIPSLMESIALSFLVAGDQWRKVETSRKILSHRISVDGRLPIAPKWKKMTAVERRALLMLSLHPGALPAVLLTLSDDSVRRFAAEGWTRIISDNGIEQMEIAYPELSEFVQQKVPAREKGEVSRMLAEWARSKNLAPDVVAIHYLGSDEPELAHEWAEKSLREYHARHIQAPALDLLAIWEPHIASIQNVDLRTAILSLGCEIYARAGEIHKALGWNTRLMKEKQEPAPVLLRRQADFLLKTRELKSSLRSIHQAEKKLNDLPLSDRESERMKLLSIAQMANLLLGRYGEMRKAGDVILASPASSVRERVFAKVATGHAYLLQGKLSDAEKSYSSALHESQEADYLPGQSMAWGSQALCQQKAGEFSDAIESFEQAIAAAEQAYDFQVVASHHLNLGALFGDLGRYADALRSIERSVSLYSQMANHREGALAYYRLGKLELLLGLDAEAEKDIGVASAWAKETSFSEVLGFCHLAMARLSRKSIQAKPLLQKASVVFRKQKNSEALLETDFTGFELGARKTFPVEKLKQLDLTQRIRICEELVSRKGRVGKWFPLWFGELEREAKSHTNPEWYARILGVQGVLKGKPDSELLRKKARKIFERLSSHLDEDRQGRYLKDRERLLR